MPDKLKNTNGKIKCSYGCGEPAKFTFNNGKVCCSVKTIYCPKIKYSDKSKIAHFKIGNTPFNKGKKLAELYTEDKALAIHKKYVQNGKKSAQERKSDPVKYAQWKENISKALKGKAGGYIPGSGRGKSGWYRGIWCDSSWELAFVIYCLDHGHKILRNEVKYPYIYRGKKHNYIPDFIVDGELVEIKGYWTERDIVKLSSVPAPIHTVDKDQIQFFIDYAVGKYGSDYISKYEIKRSG